MFNIKDRISGIIDYPDNLDSVENTRGFAFPDRPVIDGATFKEAELFLYPEVDMTAANNMGFGASSSNETNIWVTGDKIAPLEGYFIGYQLDKRCVNFASLLNTPEFNMQMFQELNDDSLNGVSTSFYYFLHSLPFNPPVPIKITDKKLQTTEKFEANPALLFKNNAGVYSIPDPYMWWLGGIWNYRNYKGSTITQPEYLNFVGNVSAGFTGVNFGLDKDNKDVDGLFFYDKETNKLAIDGSFFKNYDEYWVRECVMVTGNNYFIVDSLNGIGNHQDLFNVYYKEFYGVNLPILSKYDLLTWNIDNKIKTFPTYSYDVYIQERLSLYASYGILNFSGLAGSNGEYSNLAKIDSSSDLTKYKTAFDFYTSIWNYMYYYLSVPTSEVTYTKVVDNIISNYTNELSFLELNINKIEKLLFNIVVSPNDIKKYNVIKAYDSVEPLSAANGLFTDSGSFRYFIDVIGIQVLKFIETQQFNTATDLAKYGVKDNSFSCILYPSAGGVAGLQFILNDFDVLPKLGFSAGRINHNDEITAIILNMVLNSSRYVWGSGPFIGSAIFNMDDVVSDGDFSLINKSDASLLGDLDKYFLTDNSIHTKQANRPYFLDSDRKTLRQGTRISYDEVVDYIGTGALDVFESEFTNITLGSNRAKEILLSLLVVDKTNFESIEVGGVTYSIDEQIKLLITYSVWLTKGFTSNNKSDDGKNILNLCKVMNASLTQAQTNKISVVIGELMAKRSLLNVGSVFDYGSVTGKDGITIENRFSRAIPTTSGGDHYDGIFINLALFEYQGDIYTPSGTYTFGTGDDVDDLYLKYYYRSSNYGTAEQVIEWADYFFQTIDINPTEATIKIAKDFVMLYLKQINNGFISKEKAFTQMATIVRGWVTNSASHIDSALSSVSKYLEEGVKAVMDEKIKEHKEGAKTDINLMKLNTYYNVKSLFDNWIRLKDDNTLGLTYNFSNITLKNTVPEDPELLINHFLFVDRANRDVGHNMLVNVDWMKTIYENNDGYNNINTNISLYTFLSDLAKEHASLIHALPSFIDFGIYTDGKGVDYAGDLFGTFDYVDIITSNPKFLFQFIGNTNTVLNTAQNRYLRSASKSFSLMNSVDNGKSNISSNLGNGVNIPKDLMQTDATAMAFVVDFGEQHQQMFSNLQIDQSEYQNTEEYFKTLNTYVQGHSQSQGGNLFGLFTERSYTAQVDSLGNLMIQPLMFFELTNVPLFYGTYWITNVKHSITPNDIKTTFKGVRQPMSVLPSKQDVLLQLGNLNISSLLGDNALNDIGSDGSNGSGTASSGESVPTNTKLPSAQLNANQVEVKLYLQNSMGEPSDSDVTKYLAAAVMGNMMGESGFNNMSYHKDPSKSCPNGMAKGLIQWHSCSYPIADIGWSVAEQMDYFKNKTPRIKEFYAAAKKKITDGKLSNIDAVQAATQIFAQIVERCANCIGTKYDTVVDGSDGKTQKQRREVYALGFYNRFNLSGDDLSWNIPIASKSGTPPKNRIKIFAFGDSHMANMGSTLKTTLEKANPIYNMNAYGNPGAGFNLNFVGNDNLNHKVDILNQIKTFQPSQIWCFLGTNDANKNYTVKSATAKIIEFFSDFPSNYIYDPTKVVLISLPYYPNGYNGKYPFTKQDAIDINSAIKRYAVAMGFKYIDVFNENCAGKIGADGLHFTTGAYQTIVNCIVAKYLAK